MIVTLMGEVPCLSVTSWLPRSITVGPSATVQEVAKLFLEKQISAVPVLDNNGKLVGIVSEGDLLHRVEAGTGRHRSWWLRVLTESDTLAAEYVKSHSRKVSDVMTRDVITTSPQAPLHEVAAVMENNAVRAIARAGERSARRGGEQGQSSSGGGERTPTARHRSDGQGDPRSHPFQFEERSLDPRRTAERHRRQRHRRSLGRCGLGCRAKGDQGGGRIRAPALAPFTTIWSRTGGGGWR